MVSLDTKIQNGVTVEIITNKKAHPSPSWLNIAVTPKALSKIRRWLTSQNYDQNVQHGRDMILQALKGSPLKITSQNLDEHIQSIIRNTIFSTPQDLYAKVGFGSYHVARVVGRLQQAAKKSERKPSARPESKGRNAILVDGMSDAITRLAGCCMPAPGDSIIGFITVGRGVTVHRLQCPTMQRYLASHDEEVRGRIVDCEWANKSLKPLQRYHFRWLGRDRVGLMKDVSDIFTAHNVNILRSSSKPVDTETAVVSVLAGMPDGIPLASIEAKLWQIDGVSRVTVTHKDA
jgi:GTP pyrophosphokinase